MRPLAHINLKFNHHGQNSGYDVLTNYFTEAEVFSLNKSRKQIKFLEKYRSNKVGILTYNYSFKALRLLFNYRLVKLVGRKNYLLHYLYPENTLAHSPFAFGSDTLIASTFHQPAEWFDSLKKDRAGRRLLDNMRRTHLAIALGSNQVDVLKSTFPESIVEHIPHGVDTQFFVPPANKPEKKNVLILGSWLRDFELAATAVKAYETLDPKTHFTVITAPENQRFFEKGSNLSFKSNISDVELLQQIQQASLLFLPLKGAIANNAVLECMSCGLPVVISRLDSIFDYVSEKEAVFVGSSADDAVGAIRTILEDDGVSARMGVSARLKAQEFDWNKIAAATRVAYQKIAK